MSRTSAESGELAAQTLGGGGALEKNGFHQAGTAASVPQPQARRPSPFRTLILPVVVAAVCGTGAFIASNFYMTRWFTSATTLWFPATGNQGAGGVLQSLIGGGAADPTGSIPIANGLYNSPRFGSGPNTAMTALDSGRAKGEVMEKLHLAQRWHLSPGKAAERFNKNTSYGVDKDGLLAIQATDTDPHLAYQIVTTYVQAMQDFSTQLSTSFAHKNLVAVREHYAEAHAALLRQENELVALQTKTARKMPLGSAATTAYVDLVNQKTAMQTELNATNAAIGAQIQTARKTYGGSLNLPTSVPFANSTIQDVRKAEADFARVSAIYGPEYPGYREAQDAVTQARARANAELKRQLSATTQFISPEMSGLYIKQRTEQSQLDSLSAAADSRKTDMLSLPAAQMREDELKRQIGLSTSLDSMLDQAVTQAELAEKRDVPTFTVIDGAGVPDTPVLPRVPFMTALATVAGFLVAMAFQISRSVLRQTNGLTDFGHITEQYFGGQILETPEARRSFEAPASHTRLDQSRKPLPDVIPQRLEAERPERAGVPEEDAAV